MKAPFMLPCNFPFSPLHLFVLAFLLFQSTLAMAAENHPANNDNEESYSLRGTVVNSVTGEAVRGALVEVNLKKRKATLSGSDGSFRFEGLPSGQASIRVRKPGFFSEDEVHPLTKGQQVFATSQEGAPVVLKLFPEGVIFGTIQGDGGEPLEGMQVRLMKKDLSSGRKSKTMLEPVQTDETGTFRFAELLPGTYVLAVSEGPTMTPGLRGEQVPTKMKGYSATFFSGAPTENEATPIKIVPGTRVQADMQLASKPLVQIAGTITGQGSGQRLNMFITDAAGQTFPVLPPEQKAQAGRFQVQGVSPGSYVITAQGLDASGNVVRIRQQVNANSDVTDLHLRMTAARNIPLKIQSDMTRGFSDQESKQGLGLIELLRIDDASIAHMVTYYMNSSKEMNAIPGVEPGSYSVEVGFGKKGYVYSARYGSLDLLRENLTIAADEPIQPIELVLRDDGAKLTGSLTLDGKKASGAVLLVPENAPRLARVVPTDSAGSFEFPRLAPGNYRVLGMDAVDEVEYRDPDFLAKYLSSAQDVTLSPGQNATVQLQIVHIGD